MISSISDDDFGLSSSDEAELLALESSLKRKSVEDLANDPKRVRADTDRSQQALITATNILKKHFGMRSFRLKQEAAITRLLEGDSAVIVFPTGGGKSLCYQLPALCFKELDRLEDARRGYAEGGITLVVSPLIALMKDQVDALKKKGISAAVMDSTKTKEEYLQTVDDMRNGKLDILYCAPERLNNEGFVASMAYVRGGVRLLAVDEAHCISEWGHSFRPDYLKIARFSKEIAAERVVCLTATATAKVARDVCRAFDIPESGLFRTSTYRTNLRLHAESYLTKEESYPKLRNFLKSHPGSTIIYVTLQKQAEELAEQLRQHNFKTRHYHAGMGREEKTQCQEAFMASNDLIIVATIAFGMGIDKADIRNVIHYDMPSSLESYSQEIGRAGRDGLRSQCILYLCAEDFHLRESFARGDLPSKMSVRDLLDEVFSSKPSPEFIIEGNFNQLSKWFDIKLTTLANIFAQLELRFGILRATTPKYTKYSYKLIRSVNSDNSPAGIAVRNAARLAKIHTQVDVDAAVRNSGISRTDIVAKLNAWHDEGLIDLQASMMVNLFRVQKKWPPSAVEIGNILDALYKDLELREQQSLERARTVRQLITKEACFARGLALHFGDNLPNNANECGHCTWCETHKAVELMMPPVRPWDSKAFSEVLKAVTERDDARFLARVAFGISSPRVTAAKLAKHPVFGSMADHNFMSLFEAFRKKCEE